MNEKWDDVFRSGGKWLVPCLVCALPGAAAAQGLAGRGYFTVDVGAALLQESSTGNLDLQGALDTLPGFNPGDEIEFDPGVRVGLHGGYRLSDSWSVELETGVIWNSVDRLAGVGTGSRLNGVSPDATITASWYEDAELYQIPILANLQYDVSFAPRWSAYVAGGAGAVLGLFHLGESSSRVAGDAVLEVTERDADEDWDMVFGYQAKAGVRFAVSPRSDLDLSYKFLGTLGYDWELDGDGLGTHPLRNHAVLLSYTFRF